jgi:hypothetical protein
MRPSKFVIGMTSGVLLTMLLAGALLLNLGGLMANAASGTPTPPSTATPAKQAPASGTPSTSIPRDALEQQMLQPVSDAEWSAAANLLGMSVDDLAAALKSGKSIAELGAPHNVTAQQVKDAMVTAGQAKAAAAVQAGTISQADADTLNQGLVVAIADKVTLANTEPVGTPGSEPLADQIKAEKEKEDAPSQDQTLTDSVTTAELSAAAQTLGISNEQFKAALGPDGNLYDYLTAHNVTAQQVKDAMLAAGQNTLNQAVQNGTMTQAEADQAESDIVQPLAEKIFQMISGDQATPTS